jgi:hypothetical protein
MPRRFHRLDQFRPAMFRQPALEHFHERFLLLKRQSIGGIQNFCELCHDLNVADRRTLGNDDLHQPFSAVNACFTKVFNS